MKSDPMLASPVSSNASNGDNNSRCIVYLSFFDDNLFAINE
jgi:hypothetical protein